MNLDVLTHLFFIYKYPLIFVLTIIEGPIIMMLSGVMLKLNVVSFWPVYLTLIFGDLFGDTFWYFIGYHFGYPTINRFGKYFGLTRNKLEKTKQLFTKHPKKILFISKLTLGLGFNLAILMAAGMSKIPFKKYIMINLSGQLIWTALLLYIGYGFGNLYEKINNDLKLLSAFAFIALLFLIIKGISSYLQNRDLEKMM